MDGLIDAYHRIFAFPDAGRPLFPRDLLRVEGRHPDGTEVLWTGGRGTGIGDVEADVRVAIRPASGPGWSTAVAGRVRLPTGSRGFRGPGTGLGAQLLAARTLGGRADLYLGLGGTAASRGDGDGLAYSRRRVHGFAAVELRPTRWWSLLVQGDAGSRMVDDVDLLPGTHGYLRVGSKFGLGRAWTLEGGFTEGVYDYSTTTDFGVFLGVARGF
jgi:hypothetical protein